VIRRSPAQSDDGLRPAAASGARRYGVAAFDRPALDLALRLRTPGWSRAVTGFTDLGGPVVMPVLATVAAAVLAWWWRSWLPVVLMAVAGGGSLLMTTAGKAVIGRVRPPAADAVPPLESSPSFPSGHSLNALVIAGMGLGALARRRRACRALTRVGLACPSTKGVRLARRFGRFVGQPIAFGGDDPAG
jgi:membrane-associated phospholipid phosphatase